MMEYESCCRSALLCWVLGLVEASERVAKEQIIIIAEVYNIFPRGRAGRGQRGQHTASVHG